MTPADLLRAILRWTFYVVIHVLVMRHLVLFDYAFCFFYLGAILFLPLEINLTALLLISFATGLLIDSFDNTMGLHVIASVLVGYIRPILIRYQLAQKMTETRVQLSLQSIGFPAFLSYTLMLVLMHHTVLFLLETASFVMLPYTLLKIASSLVFTTFSLALGQAFLR